MNGLFVILSIFSSHNQNLIKPNINLQNTISFQATLLLANGYDKLQRENIEQLFH